MSESSNRSSRPRRLSYQISLVEAEEATLGAKISTTMRPDFQSLFSRQKSIRSAVGSQDLGTIPDEPDQDAYASGTGSRPGSSKAKAGGGRLSDPEFRQRWTSLGIVYVISFLLMVQNSLYWASLWPFLSQIDPTATQTFFGFVIMAFNLASAIGSPLFGYWSNRIQQTRVPIIAGILVTIAGNFLLGFTQAFGSNRKWIVFVARFITGFGVGNAGALYAYVAMASKLEERNMAIAIRAASNSLGLLMGPALQIAFVSISYPGYVRGAFHFNMYTAPAFVNIVIGIVSIIVMIFLFKEHWVSVDESETTTKVPATTSDGGLDGTRKTTTKRLLKPFDKLAVVTSIYVRLVILFCFTYDTTIGSPFTMAMFKWTRSEAVTYNGIISMVSGFVNFSMSLFVGTVVMRYVQERILILVGLTSFILFFVISFSWPGLPLMVAASNSAVADSNLTTTVAAAVGLGGSTMASTLLSNGGQLNLTITSTAAAAVVEVYSCDYSWCSYTTRVQLAQYLVAYLCMILAFGMAFTPNGTLFSKILGPRKQGTMQGIFAGSGQLAMTISPIMCSSLFEYNGPRVAWAVGAAVLASAVILVSVAYSRLVPWESDDASVVDDENENDDENDDEKAPLLAGHNDKNFESTQ